MSETCKTCKKKADVGVWASSEFVDEKPFLFCSEECRKKYLRQRLGRIKGNYPSYHAKLIRGEVAPGMYAEVIGHE